MSATGIVQDSRYLLHTTDRGHPESPRRLAAVYDMLDEMRRDPQSASRLRSIDARPASDSEILLVHSPGYLEKIKATEGQECIQLSPDTQACAHSHEAARLAVGGALEAVCRVTEENLEHGFALVRPPGHHAEKSRALGYCIFNNIALAAAFARRHLGLRRVLIVDWDVHHGNGTQHFFERDPSVLFFSIHQYPHFPKTGFFTETGIGAGEGFTINIPLPKGYGDGEYITLFERILKPVALEFNPDLILVSAGFDIHRQDPLGGMLVTEAGFAGMTRCLMDIAAQCCWGRMVLVLEGGYEPAVLASSVRAVLDELSGRRRSDPAVLAATAAPRKIRYAMNRCLQVQRRFWKTLATEGGRR